MADRARIAAELRVIASQIENDPEAEQLKKEIMEETKKKFLELARNNPHYKNRDPEQIWKALEKAITVDIKRILCADSDASGI